ncbi:putative calmodulin [Tripterygium wilfordii]|uniref:Putative calmodulin n=1 Tax=Tripterygium wilfordii TaxID=458696 RepID=A0A7J7D8R1_TRIWF|nr:putative calmodulin [Tripterygium wilfordii]
MCSKQMTDARDYMGLMSSLFKTPWHMNPEPFDRQLRDVFKVLDKDNTGYFTVSDLCHILTTNIGEKLEPYEFDEWIQEVGCWVR